MEGWVARVARAAPDARVNLALFALILLAGMWWAVLSLNAQDRSRAEEAAMLTTANLARVVEEHAVRSLRTIEQLISLVETEQQRAGKVFDFQSFIRTAHVDPKLVTGIRVLDAGGTLSDATLQPPPAGSADDRGPPGFGNRAIRIPRSVPGGAPGHWIVSISAHADGRANATNSAIVVHVDSDYFSALYKTIDLGAHGVINLVGTDGYVRAQAHGATAGIDKSISASRIFQASQREPAGSLRFVGAMDGVARFGSYRAIPGYPLMVMVAMGEKDVLADSARLERRMLLAGALATVLILLAVAYLILLVTRERTANAQAARAGLEQVALLDSIPDVAWLKDHAGRFVAVNRAFRESFGVGARSVSGLADSDIFPPALAAKFAAEEARVMTTRSTTREEEVRTHGDELQWIETVRVPIVDAAGSAMGTAGIARDITERRRLEQEHAELERRNQSLIDAAPIAVVALDQRLRVTLWNRAAEALWDRSQADAVGQPAPFDPADDADTAAALHDRLRRGESATDVQLRCRRSNGSTVEISVSFAPMRNPQGRLAGTVCFCLDVTERNRSRRALRESEERFRMLAEAVDEVFFVYDPAANRYLYVSPAYETIWGRSCESLYHRAGSWRDAVHPKDGAGVEAATHAVGHGEKANAEFRVIRPDGGVRHVRTHSYPVRRDDGELLVCGVVNDVTAEKLGEHVRGVNRELERRIAERTALIRQHRDVLLRLAGEDMSGYSAALGRILASDAETLGVERVSFWRLRENNAAIACEMLHVRARSGPDTDFAGTTLSAADYPAYFNALLMNRPIVVAHARTDVATREFAESYLDPLDISSMLDVPVWFEGNLFGVVCHEHTGPPREWGVEDVDFAVSVANLVALALEARKRQELIGALAQSEERHRTASRFLDSVIENIPNMIFVKDAADLKFIRLNAAGEQLLGYPRAALTGKSDFDFFPREQAEAFTARDRETLATGARTTVEGEVITVRDGGERRLRTHKVPVLDANGVPAYLLGISEDVTEMKMAERRLRDEQQRLELALYGGDLGLWDWHIPSGRITFNERWTAMLGYRADEVATDVTGRARLIHPDDSAQVEAAVTAHWLGKTTAYEAEYRMRRKDGSWCWILDRGKVVERDPAGNPVRAAGTHLDISGRKQAESRIMRLNAELAFSNRELEAFSYSVAHDLRAPLRALSAFSGILLENHREEVSPQAADALSRVRTAAHRMSELVDGLLSLSRVARTDLNTVAINMADFARECAQELRRAEPGRLVDIVIPPAIPATGDPTLLKIAVSNLIGNAWKFTARSRPARIEVGMIRHDGEPVFYVQDNGAGFDATYAHKLFEPFQRLHSAEEFPGIGIGLATVKRIVERHGGRLWAESALETGARFSFTLALRNDPRAT